MANWSVEVENLTCLGRAGGREAARIGRRLARELG
jgi:hypothetical protein